MFPDDDLDCLENRAWSDVLAISAVECVVASATTNSVKSFSVRVF